MPGYRLSGGKWLEILEPGALVNLPIEVDVYDGANPATMLATMETAQDAALQIQLSELGAGRFAIDRAHPKATADNLARGNLVKIKTGGVYRGSFWIEEPEEILTSTQEASGELVRIAGRGALACLEQAVVYPPVWPIQPGDYVGASHGANAEAGATTISISKPAGVANGDVLIAAIAFVGGSTKTISPPLGWKEFRRVNYGTTIGTSYFRKQATTSEPATYQWAFSNVTGAVGNIVALRNVTSDQTQYAFAAKTQGSGTAIANPSLDVPTVDGVLLTFSTATAGSGMTPPVGLTEATDDAQRTNRKMESAYLVGPALGETGDLTTTNSASGSWIGSQIFLPSTATLDVSFGGDTPGAMMATLIDRAQARGALVDVSYDFTASVDSQGQPWPDTHELTFHAGTTLLDVFRQLVALGVEGEMSHDLRLSLYVDRSRDRTGDVIFRKGYHLLGNVSNQSHLAGLRTRLLVEGAGGRIIEVGPSGSEANPKLGRREGYLSMATSDAATDLARAGTKSLELAELEDQSRSVPVTHGLLTVGHYEPWEDYRPGDYVGLDAAGTGVYSTERVVGITIAQAGPLDYSVTLNLNSIYLEAAVRMRRELDALAGTGARSSGGSSLGLGGGGASGGGGSSSGLVAATAGDVAGYLYDKVDVTTKIVKTLGGVAGNRTLGLDVSTVDLGTGTPSGSTFLRGDGAWAVPGGASLREKLWTPPGSPAFADEFADDTIDAGWTALGPAGHGEAWTEGADVLSFLHGTVADTGSGGQYHCRVRAVPGGFGFGDYIEAAVRAWALATAGNPMVGIVLTNGSTYVNTVDYVFSGVYLAVTAGQAGYATQRRGKFATTESGTKDVQPMVGPMMTYYLRLMYVNTNTFRSLFSPDGVSWIALTDTTYTMTPTHMGVAFTSWALGASGDPDVNGGPVVTTWEYFRAYT